MSQTISVTGDSLIDWMLNVPSSQLERLQMSYRWDGDDAPALSPSPGGAALTGQLVESVAGGESSVNIFRPTFRDTALQNPTNLEPHRAFAIWSLFPRTVKSQHEMSWRLDRFLGKRNGSNPNESVDSVVDHHSSLIVVDDSGFGFRDTPSLWTDWLANAHNASLIVKMTSPLGAGPFWEQILSEHAERTTLYISVNDLRKETAAIGRSLSWERIGSDIVAAIDERPELAAVNRIVTSVGLSGAVLIEQGQPPVMIYDPFHQEGDWEATRPGGTFGLGTCVMAALTHAALQGAGQESVLSGVQRGLASARELHLKGFINAGGERVNRIVPPVDMIAEVISTGQGTEVFATAPVDTDANWQLFHVAFEGGFRQAAEEMARNGDSHTSTPVPIERMGAWMSADRTEIESMRSVRNIISEYLAQPRRGKPLNLAVFGPPGSGKSFGIKQMAASLADSATPINTIEFNLSQFNSFEELGPAFQRVRDSALQETLPLVFWDEFDTAVGDRELAWLSRFLAPMQDGTYIDDGVVRPIGPAIFVFAGGTHPTMQSFSANATRLPAAKATDFLSRLRGFVNVQGPNPSDGADQADDAFPIRRAMLLRSILRRRSPQIFQGNEMRIDAGVLRAFLDVPKYLHGARSMESIVEMSAISGNLAFVRSSLPAQHQLALHVDAAEFLRLVSDTSPVISGKQ